MGIRPVLFAHLQILRHRIQPLLRRQIQDQAPVIVHAVGQAFLKKVSRNLTRQAMRYTLSEGPSDILLAVSRHVTERSWRCPTSGLVLLRMLASYSYPTVLVRSLCVLFISSSILNQG